MQGFIVSRWEAIKVLGDEGARSGVLDEGGVCGGWRRAGESGGHAWVQPCPVTGGMSADVSAVREIIARQKNKFIVGRRTRPVGGCLECHGLDLPVREHGGIIIWRNRDAQRG